MILNNRNGLLLSRRFRHPFFVKLGSKTSFSNRYFSMFGAGCANVGTIKLGYTC